MEKIINLEKFEKIKVQWNCKSCVNGKYPFKVKWNEGIEPEIKKNVEIIRVSTEEYDNIADTLDDLIFNIQIAVITDNTRYLAIDTQGYRYPRYKSVVCFEGQILPF